MEIFVTMIMTIITVTITITITITVTVTVTVTVTGRALDFVESEFEYLGPANLGDGRQEMFNSTCLADLRIKIFHDLSTLSGAAVKTEHSAKIKAESRTLPPMKHTVWQHTNQ
jgi:hypothetical protein